MEDVVSTVSQVLAVLWFVMWRAEMVWEGMVLCLPDEGRPDSWRARKKDGSGSSCLELKQRLFMETRLWTADLSKVGV